MLTLWIQFSCSWNVWLTCATLCTGPIVHHFRIMSCIWPRIQGTPGWGVNFMTFYMYWPALPVSFVSNMYSWFIAWNKKYHRASKSVFCSKYFSVQYFSKLSILNSHINFSLPFSEHLLLVGLDSRIFFQYRRLGLQIYNLWMGCFCNTLPLHFIKAPYSI